jgi:hypothetical protein
MKMMVSLAGTHITIDVADRQDRVRTFCTYFFNGFFRDDLDGTVSVRLSVLPLNGRDFPESSAVRGYPLERLVSAGEAGAWLAGLPGYTEAFPLRETTICSLSREGLLLYDPETSEGHICIFTPSQEAIHTIHRLLWIYFAQVIGERGGCFLHAAALVRDRQGTIFLGDSGAGKSTIARGCTEWTAISDDGPIFFKRDGEYTVFPSPYQQIDLARGLGEKTVRMHARAMGLYFLVKDRSPYFEPISKKDAFSAILNRHIHFFPFLSAPAKAALFDLFFRACDKIPIYNLHFTRDVGALEEIMDKQLGGNHDRSQR